MTNLQQTAPEYLNTGLSIVQVGKEKSETCTSTKSTFNAATKTVADAIVTTINDMRNYLPLTVRQVYYQLVSKQIIENRLEQYRKVSRILVKLREEDVVPWAAIEDRSRRTTDKRGYTDVETWLAEQLRYFHPRVYCRCYIQGQTDYVEVSTEKDALSSILENELWMFCTRLNVVRGQVSATFVEQMARRFDAAVMQGQRPVLLHFGDLDPSGVAIPKAIKRNLYDRHDIDVDVRHIALTPEQVDSFNLPRSVDAVKKSDPNYKTWLETFGPKQPAVELDALHPESLKTLLREALEGVYDIGGIDVQREKELDDRRLVKNIFSDIQNLLIFKYRLNVS